MGSERYKFICALQHMLVPYLLDIHTLVQCGWYYPHDPRKIMAKWHGWMKLQPKEGDDTLAAIIELAPTIPVEGRVDDAVISRRLPFLPPPAIANVAALGVFRDRTCVFNAPGYNDARDAAAPERAAKQKKAAEEKALEAPTEFILYSGRGHGKFSQKQVCAQLALRGIKFKAQEKVGLLDNMWKEYDATAANVARLRREHVHATPVASPVASPQTAAKRARSAPLASSPPASPNSRLASPGTAAKRSRVSPAAAARQ